MRAFSSLVPSGAILLLALAAAPPPVQAQTPYPTRFSPALLERADVKKALAFVDAGFDRQVEEWIRLTEIPAQSTFEAKRGAYVKAELDRIGLTATIDALGNVTARRRGTGGGATVVFAAHLDTVHPMATDVTVTRKSDGTLHAPGVFDDSAGVVNLLQTARAMQHAGVRTAGDIIFLFTVQEELGLKGMYHWLEQNPGAAGMLIAVDGGLGPVNYGALGIYWLRMIFSGDGAHTNQSQGKPNPARAAAECITKIYDVPLPGAGAPVSAIYNVGGMMTAGNVVNAIPQEVTFTVDLRTTDPELLGSLEASIVKTCQSAASAHKVTFRREFIQKSEAGGRPDQLEDRRRHPLVQTAVDILRHLQVPLPAGREAVPTGSTDANAGVVAGIPSISVGRSFGGDQHTLQEWADIKSARTATHLLILLAAAMGGSPGVAAPSAQQTGAAHHLDARGKSVMGFDQQKTTHRFLLFDDGGAIDVSVKDPKDSENLEAIRSHLPHISHLFADGQFDAPMLVHDRKDVPGTTELARLKDRVKYTYVETKSGGRVDIVTTDKAALAAVHAFLAYQINDHQTGDSLQPAKRK